MTVDPGAGATVAAVAVGRRRFQRWRSGSSGLTMRQGKK